MDNNDNKNKRRIIILLIIIIILLYLLIHKFGNIEHHGLLVPTGNVDIFELDCGCSCDNPVFNEDGNLIVYDNEKEWDNNILRIFTNPAYEYKEIIAPGSYNSYAFVIRNNNDYDVLVDLKAKEENEYGVNMKYKLKHQGNYLLGSEDNYIGVENLKLEKILIKAHDQKSYILDWKWEHSKNDTKPGLTLNSKYILKMSIKAVGV